MGQGTLHWGGGRPVGMESLCWEGSSCRCPQLLPGQRSAGSYTGPPGMAPLPSTRGPRSPGPLGSQPPAAGLGSAAAAAALAYPVRPSRSRVLVSLGRILSPLGPEHHQVAVRWLRNHRAPDVLLEHSSPLPSAPPTSLLLRVSSDSEDPGAARAQSCLLARNSPWPSQGLRCTGHP